MQMRVHRLRDTLKLLDPVVPRKPTLKILANVLLKDGKAHATDLDTWAIMELPEVDEDCLIPHRPVIELLENVPGHEELTIEVKEKTLYLSWSSGKASYEAADANDYPILPDKKVAAEGDFDGDLLVAALKSISSYCATEDSRPVLTGVTLYLGENMSAAAGDGFRMGCQDLPFSFPLEQTMVIPLRTVKILAQLWKKCATPPPPIGSLVAIITAKRNLHLSVNGDNKAYFRFGRAEVIANLIDGAPPEFKKLVPEITANKVRLLAPEFERALRRIKDVAYEGSGIARLTWAESVMTVSAKAAEKGEVEVIVPAVTDDGPGKIAINIKYLLEYFSGKDDFVTMGTTDAKSPAVFTYHNYPLVVMMPMFVKADDEADEE